LNWQLIQTIFIQAIISIILNGVLVIFLWRRKKQEDLPTEFEVFKNLVMRRLDEGDKADADLALAQVQLGRDMVGVREAVMWIKGKINGKGWTGT
jgi:hypothetical protein